MRKFILTTTFIISTLCGFGQDFPEEKERPVFFEKPQPEWKQKIRYGGNLWLGFFGAFYVDVSPMVGYELTKKGTFGGIGATIIYQGAWQNSGEWIVGPRLWLRQQVFKSVFVHAEYEFMNAAADRFYSYNSNTAIQQPLTKKWEGSPLIGIGFYQGRGATDKGSFLSLMYNLGYPNRGFVSPQGLGGNQSPLILRYGFLF
jgi:hypothetical protein